MTSSVAESRRQLDIFGNLPPASNEFTATVVKELIGAFGLTDQMNIILANCFKEAGFSEERLKYIRHEALFTDRLINQARFGKICVADFLSMTEPLPTFQFSEAEKRYQDGDRSLVWVKGGIRKGRFDTITTLEAAEFGGLEHIPFVL